MKKYKKFNVVCLLGILMLILSLSAVNYVVDPFYIFHTNYFPRQFQANERFNKSEFLNKNMNYYNSYILGSSRIGTTEPAFIQKYLPDAKFYNLCLSGGTMYDNLESLKYIKRKDGTIKNIYLQIDITEFLSQYKYPADNYLFRYSPETLNMSVLQYKLSYLTITPYMNIMGKIQQNMYQDIEYANVDFERTGCWYRDAKETAMTLDPEAFIAQEKSFHIKSTSKIKDLHVQENLEALKEIVDICQVNNINLILFTTPHNHKMMECFDVEDYARVLRLIANIHEYWDFTGYNTITVNNKNYYETSHYRPHIAKLVAAKIFADGAIDVPPDFGVLVNKENIDSHLQKRQKEIGEFNHL